MAIERSLHQLPGRPRAIYNVYYSRHGEGYDIEDYGVSGEMILVSAG